MTRIYNKENTKKTRRRLRGEMPRAEVLLWSKLRNKQLMDLKFRRQFSVGPYLIDFYCPQVKLAIEIDGDSHFGGGAEERDKKRQSFIESYGIEFIRCTNGDVYDNINGVLEEIVRVAQERLKQ